MIAFRRRNRLVQMGSIALTLAGCASAEQVHQAYEPVRSKVSAEVQEVAAHVKPEHFERCRQLLAGRDILQTEYRTKGDFHLNLKMSCRAQDMDMGFGMLPRNYKVAVYQVGNEKTTEGLNLRGNFAACEMRLLPDGTIDVRNGAVNSKAPGGSACIFV